MAVQRILTKRLYNMTNGGNNNVSLDYVGAYNAYPYGNQFYPPTMRIDLLSPNNEPVLYKPQGYGDGSAQFINAYDIIYTPVNGSQTPLSLVNPAFGVGVNNYDSYFGGYGNGYGYGRNALWANDFNSVNAL